MRLINRSKFLSSGVALVAAIGLMLPVGAAASSSSANPLPTPGTSGRALAVGALSAGDRKPLLGNRYKNSNDNLWALTSSATGVGVLRATVSSGARWTKVASLGDPELDSRQWIAQGCQIPNSEVLAVMYGPVEYISVARMFESGGYSALVNLKTGRVTSLQAPSSFAYFSPTCSADGTAAFTSYGSQESTSSVTAYHANGRRSASPVTLHGEFTSAISTRQYGLVAASGSNIVQITSGGARVLKHESAPVLNFESNSSGDLFYSLYQSKVITVRRLHAGASSTIATAGSGDARLDVTSHGQVLLHGATVKPTGPLHGVRVTKAPASATPSADGNAYTSTAGVVDSPQGVIATISSSSGLSRSIRISQAIANAQTPAQSPRRSPAAGPAATSSSTTDANLPCAVKRNDVTTEAYQPSPAQVEWAVDQAVNNNLKKARSANYRHFGLPAYSAQGLEPLAKLTGGGAVPPQIMLGILANESNLWQASPHVTEGGYGNPETGNIYGRSGDALTINFSAADCGYGVSQVTDGMRNGQQSATLQRAIGLDYQVNIAAGVNILISKWNQLKSYSPAIVMNNGDPKWIENWFAAAWAYNSGLQPNADEGNTTGCTPGPSCTDSGGRWGLGWANNPSNPIYPPNRHTFNALPEDATSPAHWPYEERVLGWAAFPIYKESGSYLQSYWTSDLYRDAAVPDTRLFCTSANLCTPGSAPRSNGSCSRGDLHCWIHYAVKWKDCADTVNVPCGFSQTHYSTTSGEPADPSTDDPADCNAGSIPAGATVVDDIPSSAPSPYASCATVNTAGSFSFSFTSDSSGNYPSHIDLHQINGGLNGHYWFQHTSNANDITVAHGTWKFPTSSVGWGKVLVHVPALGAQTRQAHYDIVDGATGTVQTKILNQNWGSNHWYSLGSSNFTAGEQIRLSSYSVADTGDDLAWDAVAFVPQSKPKYKLVALGDSYSSGEGVTPYARNTDTSVNACHRSDNAYPNLITMPGSTKPLGSDPSNELSFLACSFAVTTTVSPTAVSSAGDETPSFSDWDSPTYTWGEELQTSQGYLDASTDAVTISVGGNDARFTQVLSACSLPNRCDQGAATIGDDPSPLSTYEPHVITDLMPKHLSAVYSDIHAHAPNAQIFVVGYPLLFPRGGGDCGIDDTISNYNQEWIDKMTDLLASSTMGVVQSLASQGIKIHYIDTRQAFAGHDACASDSWLNAIVNYSDDAMGRHYPGTGSYHPKAVGQQQFAKLVSAELAKDLPAR